MIQMLNRVMSVTCSVRQLTTDIVQCAPLALSWRSSCCASPITDWHFCGFKKAAKDVTMVSASVSDNTSFQIVLR